MYSVTVRLPARAYDVRIGSGLLRDAGAAVRAAMGRVPTLCVVVADRKVNKHWGKALKVSLQDASLKQAWIVLPDGERHKNMGSVTNILSEMVKAGADRKSIVLAFGGGVVGDMAGFAASIYMRGISVIQIPTTLLAQVDASIGGKTGVDLPQGKNLAGTFHQPHLVLIDVATLRTLPEREFRAGLFEVIKCAIIRDPQLFQFLYDQRKKIL